MEEKYSWDFISAEYDRVIWNMINMNKNTICFFWCKINLHKF